MVHSYVRLQLLLSYIQPEQSEGKLYLEHYGSLRREELATGKAVRLGS